MSELEKMQFINVKSKLEQLENGVSRKLVHITLEDVRLLVDLLEKANGASLQT